MNFGKFFRLNIAKSNLNKGITVFDYIWFRDNTAESSAEYPVYLTITRDNIDFHIHYHDDSNANGIHTSKHLHNTVLSLPLSANINVKDGLTGALVECYETNFPKYDRDGSNYLYYVLCDVIKNYDKNKEGISYSSLDVFDTKVSKFEKLGNYLKEVDSSNEKLKNIVNSNKELKKRYGTRDYKNILYRCVIEMDKTLKNNTAYRKTNEKYLNEVKKGKSKKSTGKQIQELIRSVAKEEKYRLETKFECILKECNIDKNTEIVNSLLREIPNLICISKENQLTKIPIFPEAFIRKLILDFMFDLEQTKVFQISPHYEHISVKLKENYLFSALAAKANFYYWKEICSRILLEKNEKKDEKIKELTDKRAKKLQQLDRLVTRKSDWERKVSGCIICLHQDNLKKRIGREVINLLKIKIKDIISDIFEIENQIEDVQSKNISPIYAEYYLNAELQWTKAIRNPKAQTNFNDYQGRWFDDPELEMDRVYKAEKFIDNKKEKGKLTNEKFKARIERSRKLTSKWYMERFSWIIRKDFTGWHQLLLRFIAAIATAWMLTLIGSDLLPAYTNDDPNVIENFFSQDKDGNSILWWTIAFYVILLLISGRVISYQIKQKSRGIGRDEKISRRIKIFLCRPFAVIVLCSVYSIILGMIMGLFSNKYCMPWSKESGSELSPFFVTGVVLAVFIGIVLESVTGKDGQEES